MPPRHDLLIFIPNYWTTFETLWYILLICMYTSSGIPYSLQGIARDQRSASWRNSGTTCKHHNLAIKFKTNWFLLLGLFHSTKSEYSGSLEKVCMLCESGPRQGHQVSKNQKQPHQIFTGHWGRYVVPHCHQLSICFIFPEQQCWNAIKNWYEHHTASFGNNGI